MYKTSSWSTLYYVELVNVCFWWLWDKIIYLKINKIKIRKIYKTIVKVF